jgi:hypothetical protein
MDRFKHMQFKPYMERMSRMCKVGKGRRRKRRR